MAGKIEANDVVNGLYGSVYDENGKELDTTQEFEATVELTKQAIKLPGEFMEKHKVMGATGKGKVMYLMNNSTLVKKILMNPTAKYSYIGKLADPTTAGEEKVLLKGVSFDAAPLQSWKVGELVEVALDFTFDDSSYLGAID